MASCLNGTVQFDIFYFIAFTLRFSPTCQVQAATFAGQRQFPVKVKGKTLTDFHSVIAGLKLAGILSSVSTQQTGACSRLDFSSVCSATAGGRVWICGCSHLKL